MEERSDDMVLPRSNSEKSKMTSILASSVIIVNSNDSLPGTLHELPLNVVSLVSVITPL